MADRDSTMLEELNESGLDFLDFYVCVKNSLEQTLK